MSQAKHALYEAKLSEGKSSADKPLQKSYQGSIWERIKARFEPENLIVSGREVKGIVVSPAIAGIILAFMLGLTATIYWRVTDQIQGQRDLIIELKTSLKEKADRDAEYRAETKSTLAIYKVYIDNLREKQIESDAKRSKN